jgi:hypothetical protein
MSTTYFIFLRIQPQESSSSRLSDSHYPDLESDIGAAVAAAAASSSSSHRSTYRPTAGPLTLGQSSSSSINSSRQLAAMGNGNYVGPSAGASGTSTSASPYMLGKKKEVTDQIAVQKKAAKEAKG